MFDTLMVFLKYFFSKKVDIEQKSADDKQYESVPGGSILSFLSIVLKVYNRIKSTNYTKTKF